MIKSFRRVRWGLEDGGVQAHPKMVPIVAMVECRQVSSKKNLDIIFLHEPSQVLNVGNYFKTS